MARLAGMDLGLQQKAKDLWRRLGLLVLSRLQGGSGLLISKTLRGFFLEYVDRVTKHGPYSLPGSFNVVESFMAYNREYLVFDLLPEVEHLLAADDYFEWYSTNDLPRDPGILLDVMQEGVIYSYNMANNASGYCLSKGNATLVIAGVSFVRHDNELSCFLVAGERPPNPSDREVAKLANASFESCPGREGLNPSSDWGIGDRYLDAFPGFARVIVLTRFDLVAKRHDVRYVMRDLGSQYLTYTD